MVRTAGFPPDMGEATDQRVGRCNNKTVGVSHHNMLWVYQSLQGNSTEVSKEPTFLQSLRDAVVLVRQFRYPVYASLDPDERAGNGAK